MKLSVKSKYGLAACLELANKREEGSINVSTLSSSIGVSERFLEQIMSLLKKESIVESTRGAQGGYILTRTPSDTTVGEVLRAVEDNLQIVECVGTSCECSASCASFSVWNRLYYTINDFLDSITLQSLLEEKQFEKIIF